MPLVRPVIVQLVSGAVATQVFPPGADVAVYPLIAAPPSPPGAVQVTVALPLPAVACGALGASGAVGMGVGAGVELSEKRTEPPWRNTAGDATSSLMFAMTILMFAGSPATNASFTSATQVRGTVMN